MKHGPQKGERGYLLKHPPPPQPPSFPLRQADALLSHPVPCFVCPRQMSQAEKDALAAAEEEAERLALEAEVVRLEEERIQREEDVSACALHLRPLRRGAHSIPAPGCRSANFEQHSSHFAKTK